MKKDIPIETQELVLKELEELGEYDAAENGYDVFFPTFKDPDYGKDLYRHSSDFLS